MICVCSRMDGDEGVGIIRELRERLWVGDYGLWFRD